MKKGVLITGAVILGLCLLGTAGVALVVVTLPDDITAFDDSDLIQPQDSLPAEQNAFTYYTRAGDAVVAPDDRQRVFEMCNDTSGDDGFVQELLDQNAAAFRLVAEGNRRERCLPPRVMRFDADMSYLGPWRSIGYLAALGIHNDIRQKEGAQALADVAMLCRFAQRIEADTNSLIHYLVGLAIREACMEATRDLVSSDLLDQEQLDELQQILAQNRPSIQGYVKACQAEYQTIADYVDKLHAGQATLDDAFSSDLPPWQQRLAAEYLLHPKRTKKNMAMIYSELIEQAHKPYSDTHLTDADEFALSKKATVDKADGLTKLWVPNSVGVVLYALLLPASQQIVTKKCNTELSHNVTVVLTALQRYSLAHGDLPQRLEALAPKYLKAIPRDPYDGKPLRYSSREAIVYSVGPDLIDSGGSTEPASDKKPRDAAASRWLGRDLVFSVEDRGK